MAVVLKPNTIFFGVSADIHTLLTQKPVIHNVARMGGLPPPNLERSKNTLGSSGLYEVEE